MVIEGKKLSQPELCFEKLEVRSRSSRKSEEREKVKRQKNKRIDLEKEILDNGTLHMTILEVLYSVSIRSTGA